LALLFSHSKAVVDRLAIALDDKSIGIKYCQIICGKKYHGHPYRYCIRQVLLILVPILENYSRSSKSIFLTFKCFRSPMELRRYIHSLIVYIEHTWVPTKFFRGGQLSGLETISQRGPGMEPWVGVSMLCLQNLTTGCENSA